MGMLSFIKEAGQKLFDLGQAKDGQATSAQAGAASNAAANQTPAHAIAAYISKQGLQYKDLTVAYEHSSGTVTVKGVAADQETKEKILLCCGNVQGVSKVIDQITVEKQEPEAQYYTVKSGDTLSKISKAQYGDANQYMKIFEANKPMLKDPDKIYPGQMLRIPPA